MLDWLEEDLKNAQQSSDSYPWIVAFTHRPLYCSLPCEDCDQNYKRFAEFEDLLIKYNVSLLIGGHVHVYERMLPINKGLVAEFQHDPEDENYNYIVNPTGPVHVVQGKAGHRKDPDDPRLLSKPRALTAKLDNNYSFLAISSQNSTHLLVENFESKNGTLNDYFYIIKNQKIDLDEIPLEHQHLRYITGNSGPILKIGNSFFVLILIFISIFM